MKSYIENGRPESQSFSEGFVDSHSKEPPVLEILFEPLVFWFCIFWAFFGPLIDFKRREQ